MSGSVTGNIYCMSSRYVLHYQCALKIIPWQTKENSTVTPPRNVRGSPFCTGKEKIPSKVILCSQKLLWFKVRAAAVWFRKRCRENLEISTPLRSSSPLHSFCLLLQLYMYIRAMFTEKYFSLELGLTCEFLPRMATARFIILQGQSHLPTDSGSGMYE